MEEWKKRGKEASPENTIKKINNILDSLGFIIKIEEFDPTVENCYSCRVTIDNIIDGQIGANGKGMTKELCLASAYGELMERLANRLFLQSPRFDDEKYEDFLLNGCPLYSVDDPNQPDCVNEIKRKLAETIKTPSIFSPEETVNDLLKKFSIKKLDGKYPTMPFYSLKSKKTVYLPTWLVIFLGSNGFAAGNTFEEAVVEGSSEIFERYSQIKFLDGQIVPPQIPRDQIQKYPHIIKVINEIESTGRYKVRVMDCSLGIGIPVLCGAIIDTKTGKFGIKFGSQPNMAIALERVFTEAMQGTKLEQFANISYPDFSRNKDNSRMDKWNAIKGNFGSFPAQILMDNPSYEFVPWKDVSGMSNRELACQMIRKMEEMGADVYIRDASYLGFPAVNIYAAGISEIRPVDILEVKQNVLFTEVQNYFLHLDKLTDAEVAKLETFAMIKRTSVLESSINAISLLFFKDKMPAYPLDLNFLIGVCQYRLGQIKEAIATFNSIVPFGKNYMDEHSAHFVLGVYLYVSGIASNTDEKSVYSVLQKLCPDVADEVRDKFINPKLVLEKNYPVLNDSPLLEIRTNGCMNHEIHDFYKKLVAAENANPCGDKAIRTMLGIQ